MSINKRALIAELQRRKAESKKPVFKFENYAFKAQIDFFKGKGNRFRAACTSRRSGKSSGIAGDMLDTVLNNPNNLLVYVTQTRKAAKDIIWNIILDLITEYKIDCKIDRTLLSITFPNKSVIMLTGVKDTSEVEKLRGLKIRKCYIDEAQSIRPAILNPLIDDVIIPALRDLRGELYLTGTPGPVPVGRFYDATHSENWYNRHWTAFDNPHMHDPSNGLDLEETLTEERIMRNINVSDPSYQRETYGKWIEDSDSLVFKFNKDRNLYTSLPQSGVWTYIMGVDIGYEDADAIAILGYNSHEKKVYLIDEIIKKKQNISELVKTIKRLQETYDCVKRVMDAGALGKKIQDEIRTRHGIHIDAAEKSRKVEFIELLNDDLRTGKLQMPTGSVFEEESYLVTWDKESMVKNPDRPKISDSYHSDIHDAVLYAWRECRHYMSEKPVIAPKLNTTAYMDALEAKEAAEMEKKQKNPQQYELEQSMQQDIEELERMVNDWNNWEY